MKLEIDTDKMIDILEKNEPLSMGVIEDDRTKKTKLVTMFALPKYEERIQAFAEQLLKEHKENSENLPE